VETAGLKVVLRISMELAAVEQVGIPETAETVPHGISLMPLLAQVEVVGAVLVMAVAQ
jgi:hypothetical protein